VDVRDLPAEEVLFGQCRSPIVKDALAAIEEADGVVIVTPIYKASFSGLLKVFLDLLPQAGLTDKVVLPLAVGGAQSHVLAIDYALRPVLSSLNALHVTTGLFFLDEQLQRTADGALQIAEPAEGRLRQVLTSFAGSLHVHTNMRRADGIDAAASGPLTTAVSDVAILPT